MLIDAVVYALFIFQTFPYAGGSSNKTIDAIVNSQESNSTQTVENQPRTEKLIRYRQQPPVTIIEHVTRSTLLKRPNRRRRIKAPRIKYGPSRQYHGKPIKIYKSQYPIQSNLEELDIPFDDFQNLNSDAANLKMPPSSYEAQVMNFDFYQHEDTTSLEQAKSCGTEFSIETKNEQRQPHDKYGVPQETFYSQEFNMNYYVPPPKFTKQQSYRSIASAPASLQHIPSTQYGVPVEQNPPVNPYYSSANTNENKYPLYEPKIPNKSYNQKQSQNFAEPPTSVQSYLNPNFETSSYIPPNYISHSSNANTDTEVTQQYSPSHVAFKQQNTLAETMPQNDYTSILPAQELPLDQNNKFPTYDFPKTSYEVPIYDPIPFEASNNEPQESYPPLLSENFKNQDKAPVAVNSFIALSNNPVNYKFSENISDAHISGNLKSATKDLTIRPNQKRKRNRGQISSIKPSTKHVLDVPELQHAFETEHRKQLRGSSTKKNNDQSKYLEDNINISSLLDSERSSEKYINQPWNPIRIHAPLTSTIFIPTVPSTTQINQSSSHSKHRAKLRNRSQDVYVNPKPTISNFYSSDSKFLQSTILSIEKSRSKSYYDGTVPPSTAASQATLTSKLEEKDEKEIIKGVFDTMHFKSPRNQQQTERRLSLLKQNLPKNHKLS